MESNEIRRAFLDFFRSKEHTIVPSAPMVVKNDPTLMFTNAGMNQFKEIFLGNAPRPWPRAADTQKCLRVSGKHNDLEEVGHDTYHHTMFEMLGNWSFGDYFKREAIGWAWELLTGVYGLDKSRMYATVFEGSEQDGVPFDREAYDYWLQYLPEDHIIRVNRSGMDIFASRNLTLQVGDRVMVVGPQDAVERVANLMGNSLKRLDHPNIVTIFVGIFLGIFFGSLPIAFPGIPTPVKLGLAGGPLIVSILIGRFGYKLKLVTYTTMSANLMLREIGIALFLASVGIKAGANFVNTVVDGDGLLYVGCGFLITVIPLLIMGAVARWHYKMNYFMLMGLIAGSNTDPPALAYSNQTAGNNAPAVGYSTVYPVSMFLRILTAQLLILILAS